MKVYFSNLEDLYKKDQKRIEDEIWSLVNVRDSIVVDFGIGRSTEKLVSLGARVVAVDNDLRKIRKYSDLDIPLILCDITNFPLRNGLADLSVFYFTLHEVNPAMHEKVVSAAREISSKIMLVEPLPNGCPAYLRYAKLWREAMRSIGKFEDYKPGSYWERLIMKCGFKIIVSKIIKSNVNIPIHILEEIVHDTIEKWKELSVKNKYINRMKIFLEYAEKNGMRWSDLIVIVGGVILRRLS